MSFEIKAERIERAGMQDMFGDILVPTEEVVEMKGGQKRRSDRKFFPGLLPVACVVVLLRIFKRAFTDSPAYLKLIFPVFLQRQSYS